MHQNLTAIKVLNASKEIKVIQVLLWRRCHTCYCLGSAKSLTVKNCNEKKGSGQKTLDLKGPFIALFYGYC